MLQRKTILEIDRKQPSKRIKILFMIIHGILCLDFGLINYKTLRNKLLKCYLLMQCLTIFFLLLSYFLVIEEKLWLRVWNYVNLMQYVTCVMITQVTDAKRNFFQFQEDLCFIDEKLRVATDFYRIDTKIITIFVINLVIRVVLAVLYCTVYLDFCDLPFHLNVLFFHTLLTLDTVLLVFTAVLYSVYCRINTLIPLIKRRDSNMVFYYNIYKLLADALGNVRPVLNYTYTVALSFSIYNIMSTLYNLLIESQTAFEKKPLTDYIVVNLTVLRSFLLVFSPAFAGGMLSSQMEKLRLAVYNRLIDDREADNYMELNKFILYIEARPFMIMIAKIIPLNYSLLVIVLNIMVTYLIVLIQFTHLY